MYHRSLEVNEVEHKYSKIVFNNRNDGLHWDFDGQHQKEKGNTSVSDPHEVESCPESFREYGVKFKAFSFFGVLL